MGKSRSFLILFFIVTSIALASYMALRSPSSRKSIVNLNNGKKVAPVAKIENVRLNPQVEDNWRGLTYSAQSDDTWRLPPFAPAEYNGRVPPSGVSDDTDRQAPSTQEEDTWRRSPSEKSEGTGSSIHYLIYDAINYKGSLQFLDGFSDGWEILVVNSMGEDQLESCRRCRVVEKARTEEFLETEMPSSTWEQVQGHAKEKIVAVLYALLNSAEWLYVTDSQFLPEEDTLLSVSFHKVTII